MPDIGNTILRWGTLFECIINLLYVNTDIQFSATVKKQVREMKPFEMTKMLDILLRNRAEIFGDAENEERVCIRDHY